MEETFKSCLFVMTFEQAAHFECIDPLLLHPDCSVGIFIAKAGSDIPRIMAEAPLVVRFDMLSEAMYHMLPDVLTYLAQSVMPIELAPREQLLAIREEVMGASADPDIKQTHIEASGQQLSAEIDALERWMNKQKGKEGDEA